MGDSEKTPSSDPPEAVGRIVLWFDRLTGKIAPLCHRHPFRALGVTALLLGLSLFFARQVRLDTDLVALLPEGFPSVQSLAVLKQRFGVVGNIVILARGDDPQQLKRFADDVAVELEKLDTVDFVMRRRTDEFFRNHALYYLEVEDIELIADRINETIIWHKKQANPLLVDLDAAEKPSLDFHDLESKRSPLKRSLGGSKVAGGTHYMGEDGHLIAVFVRPIKRASDYAFTKQVMGDVERVIGGVDRSAYSIDDIQIGGRYQKRLAQQSIIEHDLATTSTVATLLLVLYILFHFRRISSIPLLLVPLLAGLACVLGLTGLFFGTLNILTAFVGAILLGLGIDHGIHLLGRYQYERRMGVPELRAIQVTFTSTGRGVALAGLTTAVGFAGLAISEFRAFREFGIIAAAGVILVVIAYLTVLPAMLAVFGRFVGSRGSESADRPLVSWTLRHSKPLFVGVSLLALLVMLKGRSVEFDYDFRSLEGGDIPAYALDQVIDGLIGHKQTPVVVFVDSADEEKEAVAELRKRIDEEGAGATIDFVIASADVVPAGQAEKREALKQLLDVLGHVPEDALEGHDRDTFDSLVEMARTEPFDFADLPEDIRRQFHGSGVILVFPAVSLTDGKRVLELSDDVRHLEVSQGKTVSAAGEAMVLADILRMVLRESPIVVSVTLILVFLSMWALLGRLRLAAFCILPAMLTVFCTFGLTALFQVKLNYLNIVILPVLFGMAVDAGVHMVTRGIFSRTDVAEALSETGRGVWGSSVTTAMGFGALLLAHHPGLNSFGQVALIGLGMIVISSLVWLTALIGLLTKARS